MDKIIYNLQHTFFRNYGNNTEKPFIFFAPGRVNLIGEHTDYNGGYVFPCALSFGTYLAVRRTTNGLIRMASMNFEGICEIGAKGPYSTQKITWCNYPLGVMQEFVKAEIPMSGMDLLYFGDIPHGAGLSSSASIEMATATALNTLYGCDFQPIELAIMSQRAENEFVGMNCGIMDQFASGLGKKDHALLLNCDSLAYALVPLVLPNHAILISNTNKSRKLVGSKYNERRSECQEAVKCLQKALDIRNLGEVSPEQFAQNSHLLTPITILKRARHVITENARVLEAVEALKNNNLNVFGQLMNESHKSLAHDFEVSCTELDILVEESMKIKGTLGSRMMGAGFGGCIVSVVEKPAIPGFIESAGRAYQSRTGRSADFYIANTGDGARQIE